MSERATTPTAPPCPACGPGTAIATLASSEYAHRFQCGGCLDTFTTPRRPDIASMIRREREETKETGMAKVVCAQGCGKEFVQEGKRKENHEKKCKGADGTELPETPLMRAKALAGRMAADRRSKNGSALSGAIEELRGRKASLEGELEQLGQAIEVLEKLEGGVALRALSRRWRSSTRGRRSAA